MTRLCGVIAGNVCHYIAKQPLLPFSLDYDGWKVWDISRDMVHSGLLRNLPCLDGVYLLDGEISPFYFGRSLHVCRRLRHHGQPWRTAICFTLGESELEEIDRQYLEFAMGLMLLLNGVVTRNKRLDYPKPNRDAAE